MKTGTKSMKTDTKNPPFMTPKTPQISHPPTGTKNMFWCQFWHQNHEIWHQNNFPIGEILMEPLAPNFLIHSEKFGAKGALSLRTTQRQYEIRVHKCKMQNSNTYFRPHGTAKAFWDDQIEKIWNIHTAHELELQTEHSEQKTQFV